MASESDKLADAMNELKLETGPPPAAPSEVPLHPTGEVIESEDGAHRYKIGPLVEKKSHYDVYAAESLNPEDAASKLNFEARTYDFTNITKRVKKYRDRAMARSAHRQLLSGKWQHLTLVIYRQPTQNDHDHDHDDQNSAAPTPDPDDGKEPAWVDTILLPLYFAFAKRDAVHGSNPALNSRPEFRDRLKVYLDKQPGTFENADELDEFIDLKLDELHFLRKLQENIEKIETSRNAEYLKAMRDLQERGGMDDLSQGKGPQTVTQLISATAKAVDVATAKERCRVAKAVRKVLPAVLEALEKTCSRLEELRDMARDQEIQLAAVNRVAKVLKKVRMQGEWVRAVFPGSPFYLEISDEQQEAVGELLKLKVASPYVGQPVSGMAIGAIDAALDPKWLAQEHEEVEGIRLRLLGECKEMLSNISLNQEVLDLDGE
ncbi:hypothetical protein B0T19DRAFT_425734 [Cercophora scortea]|uniref:Uncharacterized protein n=1 Tax=Cercophora scortea TaxID=314031 RepID=A0AAE0IE02_9PEZI|nr:hypothetical protein B0T19DRAFT_425734 [Cercophora scortea]